MAQLKAKEIRNLTTEELKEKVEGLKKELFSLRLQARLGKLEKHSTIQMTKRDIARVLTVMGEQPQEKEPKKEPKKVKELKVKETKVHAKESSGSKKSKSKTKTPNA